MKIDREYVTNALQTLRTLHDDMGRFISLSGTAHVDSIGDRELKSYVRPVSINTAYSQARLLLEVSADQLMGCIRTIVEPCQTFAPFTCLRVLMEASALAAWLLDCQINAHTRVGRSLAYRHEGFRQQEKLAQIDGDDEILARVRQRIEEVEAIALECGFESVKDRKGRRVGIGTIMPRITDLIQLTLKREKDYRICSAVTHAHVWACQKIGFKEVGSSEREQRFVNLEKTATADVLGYILMTAGLVFVRPIWNAVLLFGWDQKEFIQIADRHLDAITTRRDLRPWSE